jgi:hypothetical protein
VEINLRIKIKLGDNEFEAEGPADAVKAQVAAFERLLGREVQPEPAPPPSAVESVPSPAPPPIQFVARADANVVSLKVACDSLPQAVLVVLFGQRELRRASWVAGSEIMEGLRKSGFRIDRADHILKREASNGHIVINGKHRLKRYRLTTDGVERAKAITQSLAASIPQDRSTPSS